MNKVDLTLYAITDPHIGDAGRLAEAVRQAALGGATLVQLRDKNAGKRALLERARALVSALGGTGVPLLVNDRVDVALDAGAAGVHLGQDDMPAAEARRLLGPDAIIGLTVRSDEEARAVPHELVDYVCIGGVFATASKQNETPPVGLDGLARILGIVRAGGAMPAGAIAGISEANAAQVIDAGADGIAVISAIFADPSPHEAASRLRAAVDTALAERPTA